MAIPKVVDNTPVERPAEPLSEAMSIANAQAAFLERLDAEDAQPMPEEAQPSEEPESQPVAEEEGYEDEAEESELDPEGFEDDEDYEATDNRREEGEDSDIYAVTVDGQEIEVSLDELISGYSRQSDYTKKTQAVAEERKEAEALREQYQSEFQNLQAERQQYQQALGQLGAQLYAGMNKYANVDWAKLKTDDPIGYVTKRDEFREEQERLQMVQQQIQYVQQQAKEDADKAHRERVVEEQKMLRNIIPEWSDKDKQPALAKEIRQYALDTGFSSEEVDSLVDHRSVHVLLKAMRYDALQKADVKRKKVRNKPKLVRPGAKRAKVDADRRRQADSFNKLKESGSAKDAASIFEEML
jgi:hypothetical protein